MMLPTISEKVRVAVWNPNDTGMRPRIFRSPSIVFGTPSTLTVEFWAAKYSASIAALVFESSPPMTTTPSSRKL